MKIGKFIYSELVAGRSWFDWLFLSVGLSVQVVVFSLTGAGWLSVVSGVAGIFSVILCSQGKISTFFFGFIQISSYLYLSLAARLYAEVGLNVFYLLSQFYGIYVWRRRYGVDMQEKTRAQSDLDVVGQGLRSRHLPLWRFALLMLLTLIAALAAGYGLERLTDDSQPYLDAFTTVPAVVAQVLMVMAYREQWYIWLLIDLLSVVMWVRAGDWCLAAQYAFWCANCMYGLSKWKAE